jgi:hypothetical protein
MMAMVSPCERWRGREVWKDPGGVGGGYRTNALPPRYPPGVFVLMAFLYIYIYISAARFTPTRETDVLGLAGSCTHSVLGPSRPRERA